MNERSICRLSTLTACAAVLAGCTAVPKVVYTRITGPVDAASVTDTYYLNKAALVVEAAASASAGRQFAVSVALAEHRDYKVGITPKDSIRVRTGVNIVKVPNTDRVASIGVETTDNTVALIKQIASVAGTFQALAEKSAVPVACDWRGKLPLQIELRDGSFENGCIKIKALSLPADAIAEYPFGQATSLYYYAACRDFEVTIQWAKDGKPAFENATVRAPDPSALQAVRFPFKGKVSMHPVCGVSVETVHSAQPASAVDVIEAIVTAAKELKK